MEALAASYLHRLGVADPGTPSLESLQRLHTAHVEQVPYETVGIALGRPVGIVPEDSVARIAAGWGGYCYHLNGAFSWLLAELGYAVRRHVGGVQMRGRPAPGPNGNHLALTVELEGRTWFADVGLGMGLHEAVPLAPGQYAQGPFTVGLVRSALTDGWRLEQDPRLPLFEGMDFAAAPAVMEHFEAKHVRLSTDPASGFVAWLSVQRRTADVVWALKNLVLTRIDAEGSAEQVLDTPERFWGTLADVFRFAPGDLTDGERAALWDRFWTAHRRWRAAAPAEQQRRASALPWPV